MRPGDYIFLGAPVAVMVPPVEGAAAAIRSATALGPQRVSSADLEFAVRQLVEVAVRALSPGRCSVVRSQAYYLDITHSQANKGVALAEFAKLLAISPAEIAVIGDGGNDVAMFERSGPSIAMENATPAVRQAADLVTTGNGDDGFANAIERFILGGHRSNASAKADRGGTRA